MLSRIERYARILRRTASASPWDSPEIIRSELFSVERLEAHGASLARNQPTTRHRHRGLSLAHRLDDNDRLLRLAHGTIAAAVSERHGITPAAEWLLDNFHLVETQISDFREDLPAGYYRQLPPLAVGPLQGYPRVLGIAWAYVAHTDSHFDVESLRRFVRAYQLVQPLTIGELWAVAITLRFVLIENLRRAAERIVTSRAARSRADEFVDRLLGLRGQPADPTALESAFATGAAPSMAFVVQVVRRLRDQDPSVTPSLAWLDTQLTLLGTNADEAVRAEHLRQGGSNITVRNIITSMRRISELDWSDFFEEVSLVDATLREAGGFGSMDFATRNLYRDAIEHLARGAPLSELAIAQAALARAGKASDARARDPGYHLIANGRADFERSIGFRSALRDIPGRWVKRCGASPYINSILLVAALSWMIPLLLLEPGGEPRWKVALFAVLAFVPAIDAAVALVNRLVMRGFGATILPGMALADGVPASLRTLVAVPTMLTDTQSIVSQLEGLEVHFLSSPPGDIHFALLTDFRDADSECLATDEPLLQAAIAGIAHLNERWPTQQSTPRFLLLHRRRLWSRTQGRWMGWERKRGKLHELNQLLRGARGTSFLVGTGETPVVPADVRYVITLDADTRLPRDTVQRLIGKMAHPLNCARFDPASGRVLEGYAVLQPRITASLPMDGEQSIYLRITSSAAGIDPYSAAASDVYQDLFGEGSYAGKGIYDIDAFEASLQNRTPEASLLSHDLFEGLFARAGLASDIEVVEDFPTRHDVAAARSHRWARGDWQLLPWVLGRRLSRLSLLGYWKLLDNLRRTASAPAGFAVLLLAWTSTQRTSLIYTAFVLLTMAIPTFLPATASLMRRRRRTTLGSHLRAIRAELWLATCKVLLQVTLLADQAWLMLDAMGRTLFRLYISHLRLLDWITAAESTACRPAGLARFHRTMLGGLLLTVVGVVALGLTGEDGAWVATPFVLLWLAAPTLAMWISASPPSERGQVTRPADARTLRQIARRTWRYFETFVTAADHHLPPDNYQEAPHAALARRTSPTNIGLYLLAVASARDLGWISTAVAVARIESTQHTLRQLQRYRGHFLNWYDTQDLRALDPPYVSTVDSGNLAAHLITLAQAAKEWSTEQPDPARAVRGCADALFLAQDALQTLPRRVRTRASLWQQLETCLADFAARLDAMHTVTTNQSADVAMLLAQAATLSDLARTLDDERTDGACADLRYWCDAVLHCVESGIEELATTPISLAVRLLGIESTSRALANDMSFGFLLDPERKLLSIGYQVSSDTLDPGSYDLLASEARLTSFFAIAKGDVPAKHWYRLGRPLVPVGTGAALLSWSGSMFEYLMPGLVMRAPPDSLLGVSIRRVVQQQLEYGADKRIPWGISESAYNARDLEHTYQYSNFGVPGLGLRRGLARDLVVSPYSTALAAMVDPAAAIHNFARLAAYGALGRHGFHEALDYTRSRLPEGERFAIVNAYMAHHQGMSIVAIANVLLDGIMRRRFHREPVIRATELLLQERMSRDVSAARPQSVDPVFDTLTEDERLTERQQLDPRAEHAPRVQILSNGRYSVMVTAAGGGYSHWRGIAITRWRADSTRDDQGSHIYLRDMQSEQLWSACLQPCSTAAGTLETVLTEDRATFRHLCARIATSLEVIVSSEEDAEVRQLTIRNEGSRSRDLEITASTELVLGSAAADDVHQAFSKLFVQTEFLPQFGALIATRRRRAPDEAQVWVAQQAIVEGSSIGPPEFETDRARFLGRGHDSSAPAAITEGRPLSGTVGTVLDPIFALRHHLNIPAGATARITYWTTVAPTREALLALLGRHQEPSAYERASTLAFTQAQIQLRHLGINAAEASLFQRLAGHLLFTNALLRPAPSLIEQGSGNAEGLWTMGISGDRPIVLLRIDAVEDIGIVRQLLQAHEYWQLKQLPVDLVILNERPTSYLQELQAALDVLVRTSQTHGLGVTDLTHGAVFMLRRDSLSPQTSALLAAVACAVLVARRGSIAEQLDRRPPALVRAGSSSRTVPRGESSTPSGPDPASLEFFNGLGGFSDEGREYVTLLGPGQRTPAPWINVIANPSFGFQVATEGSGWSWSINSRENQLTRWSNDPVEDATGECLFVRDDDTGDFWSATAAPMHDARAFHSAAHGQGYSRFHHRSRGIALQLLLFVPLQDPLKISRLTLRNESTTRRHLTVTAYAEWVLGALRATGAPHLVTWIDPDTGALFARNPWNRSFGSRVAFMDFAGMQTGWTADREEFIGRHGRLARPVALLSEAPLSGRTGAGLDPCGVLQQTISLEPGETREVVLFLGQANDATHARELVLRHRKADLDALLNSVEAFWTRLLTTVQVQTPDRSMDLLLNRWALYQTLSCRIFARAGLYQASGAYGFRDQLQDGMALVLSQPLQAREHLLRAAGRQFPEGDVQHWWLPVSGAGVRTLISDDRVWLAHATTRYVLATGDAAILDETVPFIAGAALVPGSHEAFFEPSLSPQSATLFEHCALALEQSLGVGEHGLPLIGTGDWNDGMNRVGAQGRGESVWLGWFLASTLRDFMPVADHRLGTARRERWNQASTQIGRALEESGWDGQWYRRGFFDDGTPLGSAANAECRIDSIAQSWSVLSGIADPARSRQAMGSLDRQLIRQDSGLALLFTPPFDHSLPDPGYIKGYPPGLRENGGQYTHAAAWSVMAFAALGEAEQAMGLFAMVNPVNRATTRAATHRYKVEPYVVAADVYSVAPHEGRGGWTWYTGSAGWLYRAGLESLLGFQVQGEQLTIAPCIPAHWPTYTIQYRHRHTLYEIVVLNPGRRSSGTCRTHLDGVLQPGTRTSVRLVDDGAIHALRVELSA